MSMGLGRNFGHKPFYRNIYSFIYFVNILIRGNRSAGSISQRKKQCKINLNIQTKGKNPEAKRDWDVKFLNENLVSVKCSFRE